jgi:hypothetical protein
VKFGCALEFYDDIVTALRSGSVAMEVVIEIIRDLRRLPHEVLPATVDVAEEAMRLYSEHGGSRKVHYSDKLGIRVFDLHEI